MKQLNRFGPAFGEWGSMVGDLLHVPFAARMRSLGLGIVGLLGTGCAKPPASSSTQAPERSGAQESASKARQSSNVAPARSSDGTLSPSPLVLGRVGVFQVSLVEERTQGKNSSSSIWLTVTGPIPAGKSHPVPQSTVVLRIPWPDDGEMSRPAEAELSIVVDDFNFDGHLDFAVPFDNSGPYGSATYQVFVYEAEQLTFIHAAALSQLTDEHMGLFEVDSERKRLKVYSKSGCCIHSWAEYSVVGATPQLIFSDVESLLANDDASCQLITKRTTPQGSHVLSIRQCPEDW